MRVLAVLAIVSVLTVPVPASAGPFEDATSAYKRGDYATAMRLIRPLAEQGDAVAKFNLGVIYDRSEGVPQEYPQA